MLRWPFIILVALAVLWSAYWGAAAFALKQGTEALLRDQQPYINAHVAHAQVRGYPASFQLQLTDIAVGSENTFAWNSPMLQVSAQSYSPQAISIDVASPQHIRSRLGNIDLTASDFQITLLVKPELSLPLGSAQMVLEGAHLSNEAGGWQVQMERLMVSVQDAVPSGAYDMLIGGSALNISDLFPELPETHHQIQAMNASVQLAFTRDWDLSLMESGPPALRMLTIEEAILLVGSSQIALSGQLERAENNTLMGTLLIDVTGWRELLAVLRQAGYLDADVADLITEFLAYQPASESMTIPLDFQNGHVRFGMFTLGVLPPLP